MTANTSLSLHLSILACPGQVKGKPHTDQLCKQLHNLSLTSRRSSVFASGKVVRTGTSRGECRVPGPGQPEININDLLSRAECGLKGVRSHKGAESLALAIPILCPTQLNHAARSQLAGQAGTQLRAPLCLVPFLLPIICCRQGGPSALRQSGGGTGTSPLFASYSPDLERSQILTFSGAQRKATVPGLSRSACEGREAGTTLLPARIPPVFKCRPVPRLLHLPLGSGTWRHIVKRSSSKPDP